MEPPVSRISLGNFPSWVRQSQDPSRTAGWGLCLSRPLPRPHIAVHRWPGPALLPLQPGEVLTPGGPMVTLTRHRPGCWEPCWRAVRGLPLSRPPACGEKGPGLTLWGSQEKAE